MLDVQRLAMTLDDFSQPPRHAKPVRCPLCRRSSLVLVFDSLAEGMVCRHCHEKLATLRKEAVVLARDLGAAAEVKNKGKRAHCPRCEKSTDILMFDSPLAGMVCRSCHGDLVYFRQEIAGLIPEEA